MASVPVPVFVMLDAVAGAWTDCFTNVFHLAVNQIGLGTWGVCKPVFFNLPPARQYPDVV